MRMNSEKIASVMKKYNLESTVDELFMNINNLFSLGSNDEGEILYDLKQYWVFADGFCRGYLNAKGYSYD